jgi:hypothetical protein
LDFQRQTLNVQRQALGSQQQVPNVQRGLLDARRAVLDIPRGTLGLTQSLLAARQARRAPPHRGAHVAIAASSGILWVVMKTRDLVLQTLETLSEPEMDHVARLLAVLKSRPLPPAALNPEVYGPLYKEFAAEDRLLAEEGFSDYSSDLQAEDHR